MRVAIASLAAFAVAGPAFAVGLAPLAKEGLAIGPSKAFYLTVINPYAEARAFRIYVDDRSTAASAMPAVPGEATENVAILPATVTIKPAGQRKILVVMRDLAPGETRNVRVCAELAQQEGMINARVCSKLSASRPEPRLARRA